MFNLNDFFRAFFGKPTNRYDFEDFSRFNWINADEMYEDLDEAEIGFYDQSLEELAETGFDVKETRKENADGSVTVTRYGEKYDPETGTTTTFSNVFIETKHTKDKTEREMLQEELEAAVEAEDYLLAAELKDKLSKLD